jgi:hypothetical protein
MGIAKRSRRLTSTVTKANETAQVGGEKTEAGNPGGPLPAGHEEIFAGVRAAFQVKPIAKASAK